MIKRSSWIITIILRAPAFCTHITHQQMYGCTVRNFVNSLYCTCNKTPHYIYRRCRPRRVSLLLLLLTYMWWGHVSELWPLTSLLFIPQMIYKSGESRWNDINSGKLETNLTQCHFVHHKTHMVVSSVRKSVISCTRFTISMPIQSFAKFFRVQLSLCCCR
jgi:hypothetical protein